MAFFFFSETEEKEIEVLTKLKETVDKQREDLRKIKREIQQKNVDIEAVSPFQLIKAHAPDADSDLHLPYSLNGKFYCVPPPKERGGHI